MGWGQIFCGFPVADGRGNVPTQLLSALRSRLGGSGALDGNIDVNSGEFREITTAGASYVVFTTTDFPTTLPRGMSIMLE